MVPVPRNHGLFPVTRSQVCCSSDRGQSEWYEDSPSPEPHLDLRTMAACCFVQVMPGVGVKAWMSVRHSPACAVLDSGHLVVLGGFNAHDEPIGMEACLTFTITRCDIAAFMKCVSFPGGTPTFSAVRIHLGRLVVAGGYCTASPTSGRVFD